jgi:hypothetical protein
MNELRIILWFIFLFATIAGCCGIIVKAFEDPWILFPFAVAGCGFVTYLIAKADL